jgi:hypothetical protein
MAAKKLKPVLIRTYSAGVHFGYLVAHKGQEVKLTKSRRIWYWKGANTLSEIATTGLDSVNSKIAVPVDITLTQAIEIIDCTDEAVKSIESAIWAK